MFLSVVLLMIPVASADMINPVSATHSGSWLDASPAHVVINPADLDENNLHLPGDTTTVWFTENSTVDEQWIFVDMGGGFDLTQVDIWNYYEDTAWAGNTSTAGRGVADCNIWVADSGASLPVADTPSSTPFTVADGWRQVSSSTLTAAPQGSVEDPPDSDTWVPGPPIGPTDVLAIVESDVRYVGIKINTNIAGQTTDYVGLSHMQFHGSAALAVTPVQRNINRVELMPNIPSPFQMKDWKAVAQGFDDLVFDFGATGDDLPLIWWDTSRKNFDRDIFALPDHVGRYDEHPDTGDGSVHSSFPAMGAVLGASLVGIDKSHQWCDDTSSYQNWVSQCNNYFAADNGQGVFLNLTFANSGLEFLYEVPPTIFMVQLSSLYPSLSDVEGLVRDSTDKWYDACVSMGGSTNPWTIPDFNHCAFDFDTMTPVDCPTAATPSPEPDAAGAIAWMQYMAWARWGDPKYLNAADWGMEYLENYPINPVSSVLLPYGAYTAARMNAELGRDYDLHKILNWCFDESQLHSKWGVIASNWGGYDVHGLFGQIDGSAFGGGGYAFAFETYNMIGNLVPVVRYDDRYARAVGKWMLNAANNARLFYPDVLPAENQSSSFWTGDPDSVIGYEGLGKTGPQGQSPYARGDAIDPFNVGSTDLGLYGGAFVGILGGTVSTTNESHILQIDCLKTDYCHDSAYPTFLYYNPESTARSVNIDVGPSSKDLYDTVSNTFLAEGVTGTTAFQIPADSAVVLIVIPAGAERTQNGIRLLADGIIVDFTYSKFGFDFLKQIAAHWLQTGDNMPEDLNGDQIINLEDFAILAENWSGY